MSWSVSVSGTRDKVKLEAAKQFDACATTYKDTPESADILAIKTRALALVDALMLDEGDDKDSANAVRINAHGSHSWGKTPANLTSGAFSLQVERIHLAL